MSNSKKLFDDEFKGELTKKMITFGFDTGVDFAAALLQKSFEAQGFGYYNAWAMVESLVGTTGHSVDFKKFIYSDHGLGNSDLDKRLAGFNFSGFDIELGTIVKAARLLRDYASSAQKLIDSCSALAPKVKKNENFTEADLVQLIKMNNAFIGILSAAVVNVPMVGTAYSSVIDMTLKMANGLFDKLIRKNQINEIHKLVLEGSSDTFLITAEDKSSWKLGPTFEETLEAYEKFKSYADTSKSWIEEKEHNNSADAIYPYLCWRFAYELEYDLIHKAKFKISDLERLAKIFDSTNIVDLPDDFWDIEESERKSNAPNEIDYWQSRLDNPGISDFEKREILKRLDSLFEVIFNTPGTKLLPLNNRYGRVDPRVYAFSNGKNQIPFTIRENGAIVNYLPVAVMFEERVAYVRAIEKDNPRAKWFHVGRHGRLEPVPTDSVLVAAEIAGDEDEIVEKEGNERRKMILAFIKMLTEAVKTRQANAGAVIYEYKPEPLTKSDVGHSLMKLELIMESFKRGSMTLKGGRIFEENDREHLNELSLWQNEVKDWELIETRRFDSTMVNALERFINSLPNAEESGREDGAIFAAINELARILAANPPSVTMNVYSPKELSLWDKEQQMRQLAQEILRY